MPVFHYLAVDADGRMQRGMVEADAPRQARAELRSAGLIAVELAVLEGDSPAAKQGWFLHRRIPNSEMVLLTRRFALLLDAGLTVEQCLDALVEQSQSEASRSVLGLVRADVLAGQGLAAALERHRSSFPDTYRALIATGEQAGELANVMSRLADHLERRDAVRQSVGLTLLYPAIVATLALFIVVGLLTYVVPQVVRVFEQTRQSLPLLTRTLLWVSEAVHGNLWLLAVAVVALALAIRAALRIEPARERSHEMLLRLPLVGTLVQGIDTARLASSLSILVGGGVPILQALSTAAGILSTIPLRRAVEHAVRLVREGQSLHRALGGQKRFPPIFIHLIASGEASGRLAHTLAQAAKHQESENEMRIKLLTGILEPAIIIALGILVLVVVLAILLPIIEMNQLVRT